MKKNNDKTKSGILQSPVSVFAMSIGLSLCLNLVIRAIFSSSSYVYRVFVASGDWYQTMIPFATVSMFFYVLIDLKQKWSWLKKDEKALKLKSENLFGDDNGQTLSSRVTDIFKQLQLHLQKERNTQNVHEVFRHMIDLSSDTASSKYSISKIFIWAMPILGFIGTVMGLSLAVENFSGFLTGDIEKIEVVKHELSKVSLGLAFAFDTTLLGLATSLIGMLFMSYVQNREEGILSTVESKGLELIRSYVSGNTVVSPVDGFPEDLSEMIAQQIRQFNMNVEKLSTTMEMVLNQFSEALEKITQLVGASVHIPAKINELNEKSRSFGETLSSNVQGLKVSIDKLVTQVATLQDSQTISSNTLTALEAQNKLINDLQLSQKKLVEILESFDEPVEFRIVSSKKL